VNEALLLGLDYIEKLGACLDSIFAQRDKEVGRRVSRNCIPKIFKIRKATE